MKINSIKIINTKCNYTNRQSNQNNSPQKINFKSKEVYTLSKKILDSRIIGLEQPKENLITKFIEPLVEGFKNKFINPPPALLLYGMDLPLIKKIFGGIMDILENLNLPNTTFLYNKDAKPETFIKDFSSTMNLLKENAETSDPNFNNRFSIIIEEPEKYIGMSLKQAEKLMDFDYDEEDKELLAQNQNDNNINYLKSLLDNCSKVPSLGGNSASLIFITDKPHLIHPDLRKGKVERIEIGKIIDNEVGFNILKILEEQRESLMKEYYKYPILISRLQTLNPAANKDYIKFIFEQSETNAEGAFSEQDLQDIVSTSFCDTLTKPIHFPTNIYLALNIEKAKRSLSAEKIVKMCEISRLFNKTIFEKLVTQEEYGTISEEEQNLLNQLRETREADRLRLNAKKQTEKLHPYEEGYLKELMQDLRRDNN